MRELLEILRSEGGPDRFKRAQLVTSGDDCGVIGPPETIALILVLVHVRIVACSVVHVSAA